MWISLRGEFAVSGRGYPFKFTVFKFIRLWTSSGHKADRVYVRVVSIA